MKLKTMIPFVIISVMGGIPVLMSQTRSLTGSIQGQLVDAETKAPLIGANVTVLNTVTGSATDIEGHFIIHAVPVGNYSLKFEYIGYEPVIKTDVIVRSKRITYINTELKMSALQTKAISVTAGYFSEVEDLTTSTVNFSYEEIRRAPGSAGDVSRILMSLPSVAKVNDQSNNLIVRGGNPIENTFYVDNIEIPNINHFPDQGSSGGPIGLIHVDFIQDVNFYTGGFSPLYGDRLSSVMDITFREGNRSEFDAQLDLNFAGFGGVTEGPLTANGSWLLSARRSYLDFVVKTIDIGTSVAPVYGDLQWKAVYDLGRQHRLSCIGVFGDDHNSPDRETGIENDMIHYGNQDIYERTAGINWRALWHQNGYSNTSVALTSSQFNEDFWETSTGKYDIKNRSHELIYKLRNVNHFRLNQTHSIEFGVEGRYLHSDYDNWYNATTNALGDTISELILKDRLSGTKIGGFVHYIVNPFPLLTLNLGLRADYFSYNQNLNIAPRFSLSYQLTEKTRLNGFTGLYYQNLPLILLSRDDQNRALKDPLAMHYIIGLDHLLTEDTRITLELYQKGYRHFPIDPEQPALFVLDDWYYTSYGRLCDTGIACSRGVEMMIQKKLAKNIYGLASFSYFRARYKGGDSQWRNRLYDNRILVSMEGGYKPNRSWEFSLRWIYAGGSPYTPFNLDASRQLHRIVLDGNRINEMRYPDYHSMNIRCDRRFHFKGSNLIFYLSVWNVYNRKNIAMYFWNDQEQKQDEIYQWLMLPIFGLEYEF